MISREARKIQNDQQKVTYFNQFRCASHSEICQRPAAHDGYETQLQIENRFQISKELKLVISFSVS